MDVTNTLVYCGMELFTAVEKFCSAGHSESLLTLLIVLRLLLLVDVMIGATSSYQLDMTPTCHFANLINFHSSPFKFVSLTFEAVKLDNNNNQF